MASISTDTGPPSSSDPPRPPLQPPQPAASQNTLMSKLSYFTEPISYTVKGLARRLSEDEPPTALARALSANHNGSMTDPTTGVYHPPQAPMRRKSPFQPPPLTPLTLNGYNKSTTSKARLLRKAVAEEIRLLIPPRLQLMDHWSLVYSLEQNGSTLSTLYSLCDQFRGKRGGFLVVVRDSTGGTFGAYLSEAPKPQPHYFGNGECFLWRAFVLPAIPELLDLPPPPSADTTHAQRMTTVGLARSQNGSNASLASLNVPGANGANGSNGANGHKDTESPERIRFKAFPYTGENDFQVYCQQDYLSVGGGDGHYGLWLDQNLSNGVSDTCPTFGNEQLSEEGSKFEVMGAEIWYVGN